MLLGLDILLLLKGSLHLHLILPLRKCARLPAGKGRRLLRHNVPATPRCSHGGLGFAPAVVLFHDDGKKNRYKIAATRTAFT